MYEKLVAWSRHNNRDVLHLGVAALESFVREVKYYLFGVNHVCQISELLLIKIDWDFR